MEIKKVLVLGSGPIKIAEAAEFDYSANQALKALREEGIESIILSSNVATIQTDRSIADNVYLLPLDYRFAERVIEKEMPNGIMIGFGGQTALNVGIDLYDKGILEKFNVEVLGTSIEGIRNALSRFKFKELMKKYNIPIPPSAVAKDEKEAIEKAKEVGLPVIIRVSFNLGGRGSFIARTYDDIEKNVKRAFAQSKTKEILIEKYLEHWKELEYEIVRDKDGNAASIACLENLDPMGTHTGDSVVVTPAQTLDNQEYQEMRQAAIKVAEAINLVGECNVQFALDPNSKQFYVIETNPRMSRSSALASKATGYPIAYISAQIALGKRLYEIINDVSKKTYAFFEPSLDYIVMKFPIWNFEKFGVKGYLSSEMKSIGEVMSIGRSIKEAFEKGQKMIRAYIPKENSIKALKENRPYWYHYAINAYKKRHSLREISNIIGVDEFFLSEIVKKEKKNNFAIKQIDTLAGEWPASVNYLYTTKYGLEDDISFEKKRKLLILGAGGFRIGTSVEFDYSTVLLAKAAKKYFDEVSIINHNPETVSTDWNEVDKLYLEVIDLETIEKLNKKESFDYIATFTSGQIGNDLAIKLENKGMKLLGTRGINIERAENRETFSKALESLNIKQPPFVTARNKEEIDKFINEYGFPLIIRPSHILSGLGMFIINNREELKRYLKKAAFFSRGYPVVISKYIENADEAEIDGIGDGNNSIGVTIKHIEEAGVHSGDSTMYTPIEKEISDKMKEIALKIVNEFEIKGPYNLQFIIKDKEPYVIELNLRTSRSFPFSSKSINTNLMEYAMKGIFSKFEFDGFFEPEHKLYLVKSPQFSWLQIKNAYPYLSPEMKSTGESGAFGKEMHEALLKSWLGVQPNRLPKNKILIYGKNNLLKEVYEILKNKFYILSLDELYINGDSLSKKEVLSEINNGNVDLIITDGYLKNIDYRIRRRAIDLNIPIVLNARLGLELSKAINKYGDSIFNI